MADRQLDVHFTTFVRSGDPAALEFVFLRCHDRLRRRARRLVGDARAAEDLVQELFVALLCNHGAFEPGRPCLPYLIGALHRRAATWRTHRARLLSTLPVATVVADDSPVRDAAGRELLAAVRAAVPKLSAASQVAVQRYLEHHEGPEEIARALGCAPGTVRVQLHRGLRQLREHLPKGFFALPFLLLLRPAAAITPPAATATELLATPRRWLALAAVAAGLVLTISLAWPRFAANAANAAVARDVVVASVPRATDAPATDDTGAARVAPASATAVLVLRVRFVDGTPAPHVGIVATPPGHDPDFASVRAVTDANGRATLRAEQPGPLRVETDRGTSVVHDAQPGEHTLAIELPAAVTVAGRVVDAAGQPVAGAGIWVNDLAGQPWEGRVVARAAADGTFELRDLAPRTTFGAIVEGCVPSPLATVGPLPGAPVELRVGGPSCAVTGTVVDEHGAPVRGAFVRVARHARSQFLLPGGDRHVELHPSVPVHTDARGAFRCTNLPAGRLEVSVRAPDHAAALVATWLDAGARRDLRIVLGAGASLRGVVRDANGRPIAGASVVAHGSARHQWAGTHAGDDGSFALFGLDPTRRVLEVEVEDFVTREIQVPLGVERFDVELQPTPRLVGRFVDADGETPQPGTWQLGRKPRAPTGEWRSPATIDVAADGAFSIEAVPAVDFFCRPIDDNVWQRCGVRLDAGGVLVRVPDGARDAGVLQVVVHGASGSQLADSFVVLERDGELYRKTPDDPGTATRLHVRVPVGAYRVTVAGRRGVCPTIDAGTVSVVADEDHVVDVTVPPAGTLQLDLDAAGERLERCSGFVVDAHGLQVPLPGPNGSLALAAGKWTLWAHGFTFMTVRGVRFEIRTGEVTALRVPVRAGLVRLVAFALPDGVPLEGPLGAVDVAIVRGTERVLGGEPGVHERGFDTTVDGYCTVPVVLAADEYELRLAAGSRRFAGRFAVAGEAGVDTPVHVPLVEIPIEIPHAR